MSFERFGTGSLAVKRVGLVFFYLRLDGNKFRLVNQPPPIFHSVFDPTDP
jgi:hypothetical protein